MPRDIHIEETKNSVKENILGVSRLAPEVAQKLAAQLDKMIAQHVKLVEQMKKVNHTYKAVSGKDSAKHLPPSADLNNGIDKLDASIERLADQVRQFKENQGPGPQAEKPQVSNEQPPTYKR